MLGTTGFGVDFGHTFDLGFKYSLPYYADRQYVVLGANISIGAESFSWLTLITPLGQAGLKLELNGLKMVP